MIARALAFLLLLYAIGFVLFAVTLGKPAPADAAPTDAAVVLTGGPAVSNMRSTSCEPARRSVFSSPAPIRS